MAYQTKSIEQLFLAYAIENNRIYREEAEKTQREIVLELYRRLKVSLDMLETANEAEAKQIYKQFICGISPKQRKREAENGAEQHSAPSGTGWYPVTVSSLKHGGGLQVSIGQPVQADYRPIDVKAETAEAESKARYFSPLQEAQRVKNVIQGLNITIERVRMSVTQGEVKVYINGKYILSFGDKIVLNQSGAYPEYYYGDDIGGWRSIKPDSSFVLGLIWHPYDYVYHYSDKICNILGITQEDWIEGGYWE